MLELSDATTVNYDVIKAQLAAKYGPNLRGGPSNSFSDAVEFQPVIDGVTIGITLDRDKGFGDKPDSLSLAYYHDELLLLSKQEAQEYKGIRVRDRL